MITSLVACEDCGLLYRQPQEPESFSPRFYDQEYRSGLTTDLPSTETLSRMLARGFEGTPKDLTRKIAPLGTVGLRSGARVLDYGCSWGYGVWQLRAAGYDAQGFELSSRRASWGEEELGVRISTDAGSLQRGGYDAVFTNHVFEHIPNPKKAVGLIASLLRPGGWLIAFFPNGSDACRQAHPVRFHANWGRLHPIYLNERYCDYLLDGRPHWISGMKYGSSPDVAALAAWDRKTTWVGDLRDNEMMLAARF